VETQKADLLGLGLPWGGLILLLGCRYWELLGGIFGGCWWRKIFFQMVNHWKCFWKDYFTFETGGNPVLKKAGLIFQFCGEDINPGIYFEFF